MIAEKLPVFVVMIICIIASPIEDTKNIYIDGIELIKAGDIEPLFCMLQKNSKTIKCYEYKTNGDLQYAFTIDQVKENNSMYQFKQENGEAIQIDLSEYFKTEDIDFIQNTGDVYTELDVKKENGKLYISRIGEVIYVKADAFPELVFSVHE